MHGHMPSYADSLDFQVKATVGVGTGEMGLTAGSPKHPHAHTLDEGLGTTGTLSRAEGEVEGFYMRPGGLNGLGGSGAVEEKVCA